MRRARLGEMVLLAALAGVLVGSWRHHAGPAARPGRPHRPDKTFTVSGVAPYMSEDEVRRVMGAPASAHQRIWTYDGLEMEFDEHDQVVWVHGPRLEGRGTPLVHRGSTRAQVIAALGPPQWDSRNWGGTPLEVVVYADGRLWVTLDQGQVTWTTLRGAEVISRPGSPGSDSPDRARSRYSVGWRG